ncbi:MAG: YbaK/EbsC family protein [Planctomycetota bacterium]|jgi:prolyl-tRNA editing enzyme YbaK/EbsC (Cys-tRNA(Pro) deacylase)
MCTTVLARILALLDEHRVAYRHLTHEPTPTSADAARARGEPLEIGGKALLLKADGDYHLLVMSAARRLDSAAARRALGCRRSRFATADELRELTGLVPGSVPPFGPPVLPFPLRVDASILANERIAFNAGSLTDSVVMRVDDYRRVARITEIVEVSSGRTE